MTVNLLNTRHSWSPTQTHTSPTERPFPGGPVHSGAVCTYGVKPLQLGTPRRPLHQARSLHVVVAPLMASCRLLAQSCLVA